jgi:hypothetical protein
VLEAEEVRVALVLVHGTSGVPAALVVEELEVAAEQHLMAVVVLELVPGVAAPARVVQRKAD